VLQLGGLMELLETLKSRKRDCETNKEKAWKSYMEEHSRIQEIERHIAMLIAKKFLDEHPELIKDRENKSDFIYGFVAGVLWQQNYDISDWPSLEQLDDNMQNYLEQCKTTDEDISINDA
jgi:hypothetical protein